MILNLRWGFTMVTGRPTHVYLKNRVLAVTMKWRTFH